MLDHLAADYYIKLLIERYLIKMFKVSLKQIFRAGIFQYFKPILIEVKAIDLVGDFFQIKMQKHVICDRIFSVGMIRTPQMQHLIALALIFYEIDSLN